MSTHEDIIQDAFDVCESLAAAGARLSTSDFPFTASKLPEWAERIRAALVALTAERDEARKRSEFLERELFSQVAEWKERAEAAEREQAAQTRTAEFHKRAAVKAERERDDLGPMFIRDACRALGVDERDEHRLDKLMARLQDVAEAERVIVKLRGDLSEIQRLSAAPLSSVERAVNYIARAALSREPAATEEPGLPSLDTEAVLWVAAIDRVPIEDRIEWVAAMLARVEQINDQRKYHDRAAARVPADVHTRERVPDDGVFLGYPSEKTGTQTPEEREAIRDALDRLDARQTPEETTQ